MPSRFWFYLRLQGLRNWLHEPIVLKNWLALELIPRSLDTLEVLLGSADDFGFLDKANGDVNYFAAFEEG